MSAIHVDYSVLNGLQEVMEDEYLTLIEVFINDSDQRIAVLRQALGNRLGGLPAPDFAELALAAHSLKGSSSNMGAVYLSDLCRQFEERARRSIFAGMDELFALIDGEYQAVRQLFDDERHSLMAQT